MGAVVEDITGRRIDWDSTGVRCRVWLLPVGECQWGGLMFEHIWDILPGVQLQCFKLLLWRF